jgi:cyclic-di-AMP phosphodiesterase PgpH
MNLWGPNIVYQDDLTRESRESLLATIDPLMGKIKQGQLLIKQGALVTAEHAQQLDALEAISSGSYTPAMRQWLGLLGQVILVGLILSILVCYLFFFRKVLFDDINRMTVILLNLVATVAMYRLAIAYNLPSIYLLPFAVLPMITRALFDAWLAMVICVIATFLCAFFASAPAEFMVLQLTAGMGAVFSLINIRRRYQFYRSSGVVLFVYVLGYVGYTLVQKGDFNALIPLYFGYFGMNAVLTLIASPMLFGYEKLFGFVSDVSLMELSDTNSPLLRRLSLEAPGTFQHTLQVANLAEAAIYEIGGNALLIRVGALYHDIGKLTNPIYFIENQHASVNPHDDLPFEESAQIIIGHVHDGIQLAKEHRLPNMLIDFIRTHHGDQRVEYFYQSQLRDFPDTEIDDLKFRYPGPKPFSKETAVLMMADSVEAASRSLKTPDASSIGGLVDGIIDKQLANKQFINADITLRDIARIKRLFKKMLNSIYHVRVEYPGQKKREE